MSRSEVTTDEIELPRSHRLEEARRLTRRYVAQLHSFCNADDVRMMVDYLREYVQSGQTDEVEAYGPGVDYG